MGASAGSDASPLILALDVATATGVCEGRVGEKPRFQTKKFAGDGEDHEETFERALRWIVNYLMVNRPDVVFIEAPINPAAFLGKYDKETGRMGMTTNPDTTIRLMGLWAVLSAAVRVKGIRCVRAKVQTVRKDFIGHGNLKGHEAKRRAMAMCRTLGWEPKNQDESDAGAVWWYGGTRIAPRLATVITPMMQQRCAARIGAVEIEEPERLFK